MFEGAVGWGLGMGIITKGYYYNKEQYFFLMSAFSNVTIKQLVKA